MRGMPIREAQAEDASAVLALLEKLYCETQFLLFEPGEVAVSVEHYAQRITQSATTAAGVMLLGVAQDDLIAICFGNRGVARRNQHSLLIVMGVLQAYVGRGVGRALLNAVESWAIANGVQRLELTVNVDNQRAITLYEKCGFEREGTKKQALKIESRYFDEYCMAKLIAG